MDDNEKIKKAIWDYIDRIDIKPLLYAFFFDDFPRLIIPNNNKQIQLYNNNKQIQLYNGPRQQVPSAPRG